MRTLIHQVTSYDKTMKMQHEKQKSLKLRQTQKNKCYNYMQKVVNKNIALKKVMKNNL